MNINLPDIAKIEKTIPKKKFLEKIHDGKTKRDFDKIAKIVWSFNLSQKTINVNATAKIEEIQIFTLTLKTKELPKKAIEIISKLIPYPVLFIIQYENEKMLAINYKEKNKFFFSKWNEPKQINFSGNNLEEIYKNIVMSFFNIKSSNFEESFELQLKLDVLEKEIKHIENKIKKEKQFKYKVELNKKLIVLKKELEKIKTLRNLDS